MTSKSIGAPNRSKTTGAAKDSEVTFGSPGLIRGLGRDEIVRQIELVFGHRSGEAERRSKERGAVGESSMRPKTYGLEKWRWRE